MGIFSIIFLQLKITYDCEYIISENQKVNNKNPSNHIKKYNDIIDCIKIYLLFL